MNKKNRRFNIALYEAVFTAASVNALAERRRLNGELDAAQVSALEFDEEFQKASLEGTTRTANVEKRLERAREFVSPM